MSRTLLILAKMSRTLLILAVILNTCAAARVPYIIGGHDVDYPGKYPWTVELSYRQTSHVCSGTLISHNWVLTAAHCLTSSATYYYVTVGMHDTQRNQGDPQYYQVEAFYKHTTSAAGHQPDDIALMRLKYSVVFSANVAPIELDAMQESFDESSVCVMTGWGKIVKDGSQTFPDFASAETLQEAPARLITKGQCSEYYGTMVTEKNVCSLTGYTATCLTDSGGPLACNNDLDSPWGWTLVGIASWGSNNCNPKKPSVFTRVADYRDWIRQVANI